MTDGEITSLLAMLKVDLGIHNTTAYDTRLTQILNSAHDLIVTEGASTLSASDHEDAQIIVMYAAHIWRRRDTQDGMPRMLRWALNNRIMKEKANG